MFDSDSGRVMQGGGIFGGTIDLGDNAAAAGIGVYIHSADRVTLRDLTFDSTSNTAIVIKMVADSTDGANYAGNRNLASCNIENISSIGTCGTFLYFSGQGSPEQIATLCQFRDLTAFKCKAHGINIGEVCDSNTWSGNTRVRIDGNDSVGVEINTVNPTAEAKIYWLRFDHLSIDSFDTYTGRVALKINHAKQLSFGIFENSPVAEGGAIVDTQGYGGWRIDNAFVSGTARIKSVAYKTVSAASAFTSYNATDGTDDFVLADDTAIAITPIHTFGQFFVTGGGNTSGAVYFDVGASPACVKLYGDTTFFVVTTGVLSGTTGTDNRVTVSAHSDGNIYLENRIGSGLTFSYTILSPHD
jgi:hypothetical protein